VVAEQKVLIAVADFLAKLNKIFKAMLKFAKAKPLGTAGLVATVLLALAAILAPWISPYSPNTIHQNAIMVAPSRMFLLGTDELGRDVMSRVIWGGRISFFVGVGSSISGMTLGALLGIFSGYFGGKFDAFIQRIMDILMAFPFLVLSLAIVAALGPSTINVIISIAITMIPRAARITRSSVLSVKEEQYIEAARAIGCSGWRISLKHVLPQCIAPYIVLVTAALGTGISIEATLSFLGAGTPPPTPTWGQMLSGSLSHFEAAPWLSIFPGIAISLVIGGINLFGDSLRDVLDPRLRTG